MDWELDQVERQFVVQLLGMRWLHVKGDLDQPSKTGRASFNEMIQEALVAENITVDKRDISIDEPIKSLGVYQVWVKLHPEVKASLRVWIVKK